MLSELNDVTFNAITVDSDTSTSDSLLVAATGASDVDVTGNAEFRTALHSVMKDLALQVVRDGEGATKLVEIRVTGASNDEDARTHAMAIANSPLVKTAIAGEDPNWGRIVMAIGKSGAAADRDLLSISFGDIVVAENGWVSPTYQEDDGATYMKNQELTITVDQGRAGRNTRSCAHKRTSGRAGDRHLGQLFGPFDIRKSHLRRFSFADAALCLPQMGGDSPIKGKSGAEVGKSPRPEQISDACC